MSLKILLVLAAASVARGDFAANRFMDEVLNEMKQQTLHGGFDPTRANPFAVYVKKNGPFNHDFTAQFLQGSGYGLSGISRIGDCSYGPYGNGVKLGCNVALSSVRYLMNADVKGDTLMTKSHSISTSSQVGPKDYALIEIRGVRGQQASLDRITVPSITLTTSIIDGKLDLNSSRFSNFIAQVNGNLANQLKLTLTNGYSELLNRILYRYPMP